MVFHTYIISILFPSWGYPQMEGLNIPTKRSTERMIWRSCGAVVTLSPEISWNHIQTMHNKTCIDDDDDDDDEEYCYDDDDDDDDDEKDCNLLFHCSDCQVSSITTSKHTALLRSSA